MLDAFIENKRFFKIFINQINCPLIYLSATGSIEIANDFAIRLLELDPNHYVGINIQKFCQEHHYLLTDLFTTSKDTVHSIEETYKVENKKHSILWKNIPFHVIDKEFDGSLLVGYDVTDYKSVSKELNTKIFFYENILSKLPTNVYWKDKNCVYLGCNERLANVMGLPSRDAVKGMTDFDFSWGKEAAESFIAFDKKVMESGIPLTTEDVFEEASGRVVTVLTNKTPLKNEAGETIGVLAISVDITELKQTQAQLEIEKQKSEAASRAKSEFIANMSHDIRTPIAGILGVVQDMLNTADDTKSSLRLKKNGSFYSSESSELLTDVVESVQRNGELIMTATDELLQLCNEILEVVRLESGKYTEILESFNLHELIQHNMELLKPVAHHKKLKLFCEIDQAVPKYFKGFRTYLDRILLNLLSNALKFTEKGFVKVGSTLSDTYNKHYQPGDKINLLISVEDSGIGIPSDKFDLIFEHFSRLTPAYEGLYKGAGLGLYTVKRYVDAMNGKIDVKSEVGKGTCFTVIIPLVVSDHSDQKKETIPISKQHRTISTPEIIKASTVKDPQATVLLVEDTAIAAIAASLTLKTFQCSVDIAKNGAEAVKMAENKHYDLILMDIGLPDFSGIEATKKIRQLKDADKSQTPIIALTGHADDGQKRQECIDAGMLDVLTKPLQTLALEPILQRFIFQTSKNKTVPAKKEKQRSIAKQRKLAIIDWKACVHMCNGDSNFADELLSILANDLKNAKKKLSRLYADKNTELLLAELHRLIGGVCYLKVPQLESALMNFNQTVKEKPKNIQQLEKTYNELQESINAFLEFWKTKSL